MPMVWQRVLAWFIVFSALTVGVVVGYYVQLTVTQIRKNGSWPDTPEWKRRAIGNSGSIAAGVAGLAVLVDAPTFTANTLIFKLWLYQVLAAWGGATLLDVLVERFKGGAK